MTQRSRTARDRGDEGPSALLWRNTEDGAAELTFLGPDEKLAPIAKVPEASLYKLNAGRLTSAVQAKSCKIAVDATAVHVLLDTGTYMGFATIPWSKFNGSAGSFEVKPTTTPDLALNNSVLTTGVSGGEAFAVTLDVTNDKLQQIGLDSGAITTIGPAEDLGYRPIFDADEGVLMVASSSKAETSFDEPMPQSIHIATYCLSK